MHIHQTFKLSCWPTKNPAEEKDLRKFHLMKIKKQKEERQKQLKEAEYQKEMAKKQKKAAELLLKDLTKKESKEAEFLKVQPKNEKIKGTEDEEELKKTSKDTIEQKGLGLKTHLIRIKKEKEAMRKELKKEELQNEMEKKQARGVELLKETTQKWQKQAKLLKQMIREKDEAELQKEVLRKAHKEAGLRDMIHQEKVTEVELRKTSKDTKEQKGLKKEKEAMRKELKKEELHNEMESTQKWQKQAELRKQMIRQKTNVNTKAEKGAELKEMINKKSRKEPRIQKMWNPDEDIKPVRPMKVMKKEGNQQERWWEEERNEDGTKWRFLEHRGPLFPAEYQPFPDDVNFLSDWRREMTSEERMLITDLNKCDFFKLFDLNKRTVDAQYNMSKEEKQAITEANKRLTEEYCYYTLNQHRERIENFQIEPPGLFCGRGDHPKEGMLKRRIQPEDVIINCSRQAQIPEPPAGHQWKEVRHDNTVTWLASWTENIQGAGRYIKLNASSKPQGEKDWEKYELARTLNSYIDQIRSQYYQDMDSAEMVIRQRATALYFIDKLAQSVGSEKNVSCSSLCVKNITLHKERNGNEYMVEFDFLRKDLIRSYDKVPVTKRVYKNLENFMENKETGDKLFDLLTSSTLNDYISSLMPGLTGEVFRTYNSSVALQKSLRELSCLSDGQAEKLLVYNRANPAAAVHCNHQQADTKNFDQSMAGLYAKIDSMTQELVQAKTKLTVVIWNAKGCPNSKWHVKVKKKRKATRQLENQLLKLSIQAIGREEGRQISLSTFKSNYLDPRITIAW
ncbi:DNA topoisomerase I, mitochondrial-like [Conger conger]|uniref:DNA topoisomerase I, mitochondrial-like n=1 Tax=Conger conger TaxID=82655 RepID=UPI002A59C99B|nr:DNA topoisomerase I, mitochondrial-like [Conger conger]